MPDPNQIKTAMEANLKGPGNGALPAAFQETLNRSTSTPTVPDSSGIAPTSTNPVPVAGQSTAVIPRWDVVSSIPPAQAYSKLRVGPEIAVQFEQNETVSVSGAEPLLRRLSPFMIQVEPPAVFASEQGTREGSSKTKRVGIIEAAYRERDNPYATARSGLARARYATSDYHGSSTEDYVANGATYPANKGGDGRGSASTSGHNPGSRLGRPSLADLFTAVDIAAQLHTLLATPPLILLVNPQSVQIAYSKIQQFQDRTRFGYVFHAWGEEQPKLTITARCGAFISGMRGVQSASRRDSAAWQNLMTAFEFYKNNGYIYDTVGKSNAHLFVGALSIHYDQLIYYGNMNSFNWTLDESNTKGGVQFDIDFTVTAMTDTAAVPLNVSPLRSLSPNPTDSRYQGEINRSFNNPGEVSVTTDQDGNVVGGPQQQLYADGTLTPPYAGPSFRNEEVRPTPLPLGRSGFIPKTPSAVEEGRPTQGALPAVKVKPFGV